MHPLYMPVEPSAKHWTCKAFHPSSVVSASLRGTIVPQRTGRAVPAESDRRSPRRRPARSVRGLVRELRQPAGRGVRNEAPKDARYVSFVCSPDSTTFLFRDCGGNDDPQGARMNAIAERRFGENHLTVGHGVEDGDDSHEPTNEGMPDVRSDSTRSGRKPPRRWVDARALVVFHTGEEPDR